MAYVKNIQKQGKLVLSPAAILSPESKQTITVDNVLTFNVKVLEALAAEKRIELVGFEEVLAEAKAGKDEADELAAMEKEEEAVREAEKEARRKLEAEAKVKAELDAEAEKKTVEAPKPTPKKEAPKKEAPKKEEGEDLLK